jgi:hypothetical protein
MVRTGKPNARRNLGACFPMRHHNHEINIRINRGLTIGVRTKQNDASRAELFDHLINEVLDIGSRDHYSSLPANGKCAFGFTPPVL